MQIDEDDMRRTINQLNDLAAEVRKLRRERAKDRKLLRRAIRLALDACAALPPRSVTAGTVRKALRQVLDESGMPQVPEVSGLRARCQGYSG